MKHKVYLVRCIYNILFDNLLQKLSGVLNREVLGRPFTIDIYPTFRCNLKCRQCVSYNHYSTEMLSNRWKEIVVSLKRWLGHFCLRISGGEPFLKEDLLEIIRFSHQLGIVTVLTTNGTLINKDIANKILLSGLDLICISLDGFKEETHDFLRGVKGTYRKAMQAIEFLKDRIKLQIDTTLMSYNFDEIINLVEFAERNKLRISFQGLIIQGRDKTNYCDFQNHDLWPKDKEKIDYVFGELLLRKKKIPNIINSVRHLELMNFYYKHPTEYVNYSCQAYRSNFRIMPDASVEFCSGFKPIGNITFDLPQKIWSSKETNFIRQEMKNCNRNCTFIRCYYYESLPEKVSRFKNIFLTSC